MTQRGRLPHGFSVGPRLSRAAALDLLQSSEATQGTSAAKRCPSDNSGRLTIFGRAVRPALRLRRAAVREEGVFSLRQGGEVMR
jgi:hypothetical protein